MNVTSVLLILFLFFMALFGISLFIFFLPSSRKRESDEETKTPALNFLEESLRAQSANMNRLDSELLLLRSGGQNVKSEFEKVEARLREEQSALKSSIRRMEEQLGALDKKIAQAAVSAPVSRPAESVPAQFMKVVIKGADEPPKTIVLDKEKAKVLAHEEAEPVPSPAKTPAAEVKAAPATPVAAAPSAAPSAAQPAQTPPAAVQPASAQPVAEPAAPKPAVQEAPAKPAGASAADILALLQKKKPT